MTSITDRPPTPAGREGGFFLGGSLAMILVIVAGFLLQLAMGRSSFSSPPLVHAHAIVFMGWVVIYLLQNVFAATGRAALHRRLGWVAAAWMAPMLVLGCAVTLAMVRRGQAPFFFTPLQFLILDPLSLVTFIGLTAAAIGLRRRTDWHRRLHFCAMSILVGPGVGRLLPLPLFIPWAFEATVIATLFFPLIGMAFDLRRNGRVHRAWLWGVAAIGVFTLATEALTFSAAGQAIYRAVTAGTPGAAVAPLAFPPPPGPPPP